MKTDIQKDKDKFRPIGGEQPTYIHSNYQLFNLQSYRVSNNKLRL